MKARRDRQKEFVQRTQYTKAFVDSLNLKGTDRVVDRVAAAIINKHPVTVRTWRRKRRGPPFWKDPSGKSVLYKVQDLWDWTEKNTDPASVSPEQKPLVPLSKSTGPCIQHECDTHPEDLPENVFEHEEPGVEK
jgi:hypothetical protein